LKQGFLAQGDDEATAEEKALALFASNYKAGTEQRQASAGASRASAGSAVANTTETRRKTEEAERKTGFQQLADAALSESRDGLIKSGNPNPTQQQIEDNAIANLSPEKVQYYVGYDSPTRVSAAAEITRRKKQPKKGGVLSTVKAGMGATGGTPAPQQRQVGNPNQPTKPFPRARLAQFAAANGVTEQQAEQGLKAQGYVIQ
jgi:hypothetical protein